MVVAVAAVIEMVMGTKRMRTAQPFVVELPASSANGLTRP